MHSPVSIRARDVICAVLAVATMAVGLTPTPFAPSAHADVYAYDALGRLTRADYAAGGSTVYTYDANGNLLGIVRGILDVVPSPQARLAFALHDVTPNPVFGAATFRFELPAAGHSRLVLFDIAGREVARLIDADMAAGSHEVRIEAKRLAPGLLFARLEAAGRTASRRLVVVH